MFHPARRASRTISPISITKIPNLSQLPWVWMMTCDGLYGTELFTICADVVVLAVTVVVLATSIHGVVEGCVADGMSEVLLDGVSNLVV
jgi:hypothetical protein